MDMVRERERVVDGKVQPGGDEGDGDGDDDGHGHGGGHGPWGQRSLAGWPPSYCLEMVLLWRLISPLKTAAKGEEILWCPLT